MSPPQHLHLFLEHLELVPAPLELPPEPLDLRAYLWNTSGAKWMVKIFRAWRARGKLRSLEALGSRFIDERATSARSRCATSAPV